MTAYKDLLIDTSAPGPDGNNYYLVTLSDLDVSKIYPLQFRWQFADKTTGDWSAVRIVTTPGETIPGAPSVTIPSTGLGYIPVTLSVFPTNVIRVDVYVIGGSFGIGKVVYSFLNAGTVNIPVSAGTYDVELLAVTASDVHGTPTDAFTITVSDPTPTVDTTLVSSSVSGISLTAYNETSDPTNTTGYINVTWSAATSATTYKVAVYEVNPTLNPAVLPNIHITDKLFYKIEGLFVGNSYWIQVTSTSKFGNSPSYSIPGSNYPITIPGTSTTPGVVTISGVGTAKGIVVNWTVPATNASLVTNGGYYIVKLYTNSGGTGTALDTKTCFTNSATFAGLTTGTSYYVTVMPYTSGITAHAGTLSSVAGPFIPTAVDNPDLAANFILASNQLQVGSTSGANDIHLSAYTKTVDAVSVTGRIYIGGSETSTGAAAGLYKSSGTPFYADNTGRFSLGDRLYWSGSALTVKGTLDITGASTFSSYIMTGTTAAEFIGIGSSVPYKLSNVSVNSTLTGIVINKSAINTNSDYIKTDGSFRLGDGNLTWDGSTLSVTGGGHFTGSISGASGEFTGTMKIGSGSSVFHTDAYGLYLGSDTFASANFSVTPEGKIKANDGSIGGWTINSLTLRSSAGASRIELNPSTPSIQLISSTGTINIDTTYGIHDSVGNFSLAMNGVLILKGDVTANTGYLGGTGGWVITTNKITSASTNLVLDATANSIYTYGKSTYASTTTGWFFGYDSSTPVINIGGANTYLKWTGTELQVKGNLYATSGTFEGTITSTGTISGGTISGATITGTDSGSGYISFSPTDATLRFNPTTPTTSADPNLYGYMRMSSFGGFNGIEIFPMTRSGWTYQTSLKMWNVSNGGNMDIYAQTLDLDGVIANYKHSVHNFSGIANFQLAAVSGNVAVANPYFRNISAGTGGPSGGSVGEIWIQYA